MLITFSGVDGAGKTTHANYVGSMLESWGYTVQIISLIKWTWVNKIGEMLIGKYSAFYPASNSKKRKNLFQKIFRMSCMGFDLLRFRYFLLKAKHKQKTIVCDRYFYDLGIQAHYIRIMPHSIMKIYWRLVPKPNYGFMLDVSPVNAEKREGEHSSEYYYTKHALYLAESKHWPIFFIPAESFELTKKIVVSKLKNLGTNI